MIVADVSSLEPDEMTCAENHDVLKELATAAADPLPWCITLDNSKGISRLRFWAKNRRVNGINDLPVFMHQGSGEPGHTVSVGGFRGVSKTGSLEREAVVSRARRHVPAATTKERRGKSPSSLRPAIALMGREFFFISVSATCLGA